MGRVQERKFLRKIRNYVLNSKASINWLYPSDGRLAPVLSQEWGPSLVLWASPEEQTGEMISGN